MMSSPLDVTPAGVPSEMMTAAGSGVTGAASRLAQDDLERQRREFDRRLRMMRAQHTRGTLGGIIGAVGGSLIPGAGAVLGPALGRAAGSILGGSAGYNSIGPDAADIVSRYQERSRLDDALRALGGGR